MRDITRRTLLAASAASIAAPVLAADDEKLALHGGKPVRTTGLPPRSYPGAQFIDEQEQKEVTEVIESRSLFRWYGPKTPKKVAQFEEEFARFMGTRYALAVTSGTAALQCALTALEVGPGDEVILPAWTWYSCYNAILLTGALPVFGEVDESFTLDADDVERKITSRTKAIMVVHLWGGPADMDRILAVARKHKVRVLEDAAQSVGAQYKGRRLGSLGDIGIYSFQTSKIITAGEGGAVVTSDPRLFERATRFHDLGQLRPGHETLLGKPGMDWFPGVNYRMNEMTGGVMRAQLRKLDTIIGLLRRNSQAVKEQIASVPGLTLRRRPDPAGEIGLHICPILKSKDLRDRFLAAIRAENVAASEPSGSPYLPAEPYIERKATPHPQWPSFTSPQGKAMRYGAACCPRTLDLYNRTVFVGIGHKYTESDARDIAAAIRKVHRALA
jgi:8-amino-3,8-dideoxy-alpha-D-manno-octulosonate transaminase